MYGVQWKEMERGRMECAVPLLVHVELRMGVVDRNDEGVRFSS